VAGACFRLPIFDCRLQIAHREQSQIANRKSKIIFHPSWRALAPMNNSFENTFVHQGHEGTRRKIFVNLHVLSPLAGREGGNGVWGDGRRLRRPPSPHSL